MRRWPWHAAPGLGDAPVGALMAYAGKVLAPGANEDTQDPYRMRLEARGWMVCDGRSLPTNLYPELFSAIGSLYGGDDKAFNIPDYRGYFLRGVDGDRHVDPDVDARVAPAGGKDADAHKDVGSTQTFAVQTHEHQYSFATDVAAAAAGQAAGAKLEKNQLTTGGPVAGSPSAAKVEVSDKETRPVNVYVNYIIKFTHGVMLDLPTRFHPFA